MHPCSFPRCQAAQSECLLMPPSALIEPLHRAYGMLNPEVILMEQEPLKRSPAVRVYYTGRVGTHEGAAMALVVVSVPSAVFTVKSVACPSSSRLAASHGSAIGVH